MAEGSVLLVVHRDASFQQGFRRMFKIVCI